MKTDQELEQILRKAPAPPAPLGLEERLIRQASKPERQETLNWFSILWRRGWAPGFALFLVLAGLITVAGFQRETLSKLKVAEQEVSRSVAAGNASAPERESLAEKELKELRKQSAELEKLRAEMAEIEKVLAQRPAIAQENAELRAELSRLAEKNPLLSPEYQDAMAQARQKAARIKCVNNLKNIGLAARIWATDNPDKGLPRDFITMTNELSTPKILICPGDPARTQAIDTWEKFNATGGSYEMLAPGISETFPGAVYVRCPIHNNVCRVDGSVMQLRADQQLIQRDGYMETGE